MADHHIRRSGDDYAQGFSNLLPTGPAWPRERESVLMRVVMGLAEIWGLKVDHRAADLLERESDPRITLELLEDWERAFGLPDACVAEPLTIADRQIALIIRMTMMGAQSREFFIELASRLGYDITIQEYSPWMVGISEVGETDDGTGIGYPRWEIAAPEIRFYWTVRVGAVRVVWWRYGQAEIGIDPHLRIALATDLECILRRNKPAHTEIVFSYDDLGVVSSDFGENIVVGTRYVDTDVFRTAVISQSTTQAITGTLYVDAGNFFDSTIAFPGATQNIAGSTYVESDAVFFSSTVLGGTTQGIAGTRYVDPDIFANNVFGYNFPATGDFYVDTDTFYTATINEIDVFYTATIALSS